MSVMDQLRELQAAARRLIWIGGLSGVGSALLIGLLICGLLDWCWHVDARWLRAGLLIAVIGIVVVVFRRRLWQPLRQPVSEVEWSGRIERQFPALRGRLASAVEFLKHELSPQLGSPELQQRLIDSTAKAATQVNFRDVLDRRPATRSAWQLAGITALALSLILVNPGSAATALARLLWPIADRPWPRAVELRFARADLSVWDREPTARLKSVQGQPLDLYVINTRGELPQPVRLDFRREGLAAAESIELRATTLRDADDRTQSAAAVRLPIESGTVLLRAVGGDDRNMPWQTLELIPLVRLKSFRVKVIPPKYTGEAPSKWLDGVTQIKAAVGSTVQLEGVASRAVRAATWSDDPAAVRLVKETQVRAERVVSVAETKSWRLSLMDADQFENPAALSLSVIGVADPPPTVTWEEPAADQTVTPQAVLKLAAKADDDRGLREVFGERRINLHGEEATSGPWSDAAKSDKSAESFASGLSRGEPIAGFRWPESSDGAVPPMSLPKRISLRHEWPLAELSLQSGDRVRLQVIARDACDVGESRVGRSSIRTLTVVSAETKAAEIAGRLDLLLQDLLNVAERQAATQSQTNELRVQFEKARELRSQDRDVLKRADLDQRQIGTRLTGKNDGLAARARSLLADAELNRLPASPVQRRLAAVAETLDQLGRDNLPPLDQALRDVGKSLGEELKRPLEPAQAERLLGQFAIATDQQAAVSAKLRELVSDLTQWRDRRELARELAELADSQKTLANDTSEFAPQTLGKSTAELSNQQQADLAKLADRQARQAEQIEQLRQRLAARANPTPAEKPSADKPSLESPESASSPLPETSPGAAQAARDTLRELDDRAIAARTREAAREIAANSLGQAGTSQQKSADDLQQLADKLTDAPTGTASTTEQAAEAVADLIAKQQQVIDETERLADEQAKQGKWTRPLSKAALSLADAEQALSAAVRELQQAVVSPPREANETLPDETAAPRDAASLLLDRAAQDLAAAAERLRNKRLDAETRAHEQAALRRMKSLAEAMSPQVASNDSQDSDKDKSNDTPQQLDQQHPDDPIPPITQLKLLRQMQAEVREETERTDAEKPDSPEATERRTARVQELADEQKQLSDATSRLFDRFPAEVPEATDQPHAPSEAPPREGTLQAMQRSREGLNRRETGKPTQTQQQHAVSQLDALLKIWQQRAARQQRLARSGRSAPKPNETGDPKTPSSSAEANPGQVRGRENPNAQKSSDRDNTGSDREALAQRDRQLREAIWGHLPPALRDKMLNLPHDKLLPKYAEQIRRYYEALAEER